MPDHVLDYVLLHELAHLLVPGHGPAFWRLLASYPRLERARGFLDGLAHAEGLPPEGDDDPVDGHPDPAAAGDDAEAVVVSAETEGVCARVTPAARARRGCPPAARRPATT